MVGALLARSLREAGVRVGVMKPYVSGGWGDVRALKSAAGLQEPLSVLAPAFFRYPLAPAASALRGFGPRPAAWRGVLRAFRRLRRRFPFLVVEGIGGVLVPLEGRLTVGDLARRLKLPVWLVARPGLGTINHVLLSLEALRRRGVRVERVVLSGFSGRTAAEKTNPAMLRRLTDQKVFILPKVTANVRRALVGRWSAEIKRKWKGAV